MIAVALIAGVTWLALIGVALGWSIVGETATSILGSALHLNRAYSTYEINQQVPTRFGSLSLTAVDLDAAGPAELATADQVPVQVSVSLVNEGDRGVWSPSLEEFRLVSSRGAEAEVVGRLWSGPATLSPHSNNSMRLAYLAPRDGSDLWLEYRASPAEAPIRIALGKPEAFDAAASGRGADNL